MPYEYLEHIAVSDVAFRAWGESVEEMLVAAADATMNAMVENLESITDQVARRIDVRDSEIDMLLFGFLQELIFFKDAERLLLRVSEVDLEYGGEIYTLHAGVWGETIDPKKHELLADVKAVTLHRFQVEKNESVWETTVVLDT